MSSLGFSPIQANPAGEACFATVNAHFNQGVPAHMSDGRIMTDYRPRCFQYPVAASSQWGDNEARQRMIHGADELMHAARELNNRKVLPIRCVDTMVPELYKRVCTWNGCKTIPGNFQGIGVGRIYVPSASGQADNPQALSDVTIPSIPLTFERRPGLHASQCGIGDIEQEWSVKGDTNTYGASAKSHPYSAPRA